MFVIQLIRSMGQKRSTRSLVVLNDVSIAAYARANDDCSARSYSRTAASTCLFECLARRRDDDVLLSSRLPSSEEAGRSPTKASMSSCGLGPLSLQLSACRISISIPSSSSFVYRPWHTTSATKSEPRISSTAEPEL